MFSALDANNCLIDIDAAIQHPLDKYYCRACNGELIIKNGNVRVQHFAHKTKCDCDDYDIDMSEWHRQWQKRFPIKNREVVIEHAFPPFSFPWDSEEETIVRHRADVLCYGHVIEFQNSPISTKEFNDRNWFYLNADKKVIWIFNMIDQYDNGKIVYNDDWSGRHDNGSKYSWNYASKTFIGYKSINKDVILIFQFREVQRDEPDKEQSYFERITWAIDSDDDEKDTNFKRFCTSYYPGNLTELIEKLKRKEL